MHWTIPGQVSSTADFSLVGKDVFLVRKVHVLWFNRSSKTSSLKTGACVKGARGKNSFPSPGNTRGGGPKKC